MYLQKNHFGTLVSILGATGEVAPNLRPISIPLGEPTSLVLSFLKGKSQHLTRGYTTSKSLDHSPPFFFGKKHYQWHQKLMEKTTVCVHSKKQKRCQVSKTWVLMVKQVPLLLTRLYYDFPKLLSRDLSNEQHMLKRVFKCLSVSSERLAQLETPLVLARWLFRNSLKAKISKPYLAS